jgi:hypothetical protein
MKATEAHELSQTYCDDNLYAAKIELTEIYHNIRKSTLRHCYQAEHVVFWFKSTDPKDRALIHRHIIRELENSGFKVETDIVKGSFIRYRINWIMEE